MESRLETAASKECPFVGQSCLARQSEKNFACHGAVCFVCMGVVCLRVDTDIMMIV